MQLTKQKKVNKKSIGNSFSIKSGCVYFICKHNHFFASIIYNVGEDNSSVLGT